MDNLGIKGPGGVPRDGGGGGGDQIKWYQG